MWRGHATMRTWAAWDRRSSIRSLRVHGRNSGYTGAPGNKGRTHTGGARPQTQTRLGLAQHAIS